VADGPVVVLPSEANRARCVAVLSGEDAVTVATSGSNVVHTWHADTGTAAGPPLNGHQDWVRALFAMRLDDGITVLMSGGHDGRVCLWDPCSGDLRHHIDLGTAIQGLTPGTDAGRFTVVLEDGEIEIEVADHVLRGPERGIPS
jgi:WD40 repeat protein